MDVITYQSLSLSQTMLLKGAPWIRIIDQSQKCNITGFVGEIDYGKNDRRLQIEK